jgi:hypothetical protein
MEMEEEKAPPPSLKRKGPPLAGAATPLAAPKKILGGETMVIGGYTVRFPFAPYPSQLLMMDRYMQLHTPACTCAAHSASVASFLHLNTKFNS